MTRRTGHVDASYLDIAKAALRAEKERSYEHLRLKDGHVVLEVGCGPATDTLDLAERVGNRGNVLGIDIDPKMIERARQRTREAGLTERVTHQVADATALPLADDTFDAVRAERVLQHLPEPLDALSEMVRVARHDGRVVVMDTDWGSLSIDTPEIETFRTLARIRSERASVSGYVGRQLYRLFRQVGLRDITIEPHPVPTSDLGLLRLAVQLDVLEETAVGEGLLSHEEVQRWRTSLNSAAETGTLFGYVTFIIASGTKA